MDLVNPGGSNKLICRPGAKIQEIKEALIDFESQYDVNRVVVHVATNHVPQEAPQKIAQELLEFIDDIKLNMPKTHVFISLVLPRHGQNWLGGINRLNHLIVDASHRMKFNVIQHPDFASRGFINEDLLAGDKLHLSRLGIKQLGADIKQSLRNHKIY